VKNTRLFNLLILSIFLFTCRSVKDAGLDKVYQIAQIKTQMGEILFFLFDETPNHKAAFIKLAKAGFWDSLTFNRVIKNFVIQGGCPDNPDGTIAIPDSTYLINPEFNTKLKHKYGAVGIGRDMNPDKISSICQFYIVQKKEGLPRLDGDYSIIGQVFKGMDVVDKIASVQTDTLDSPLATIKIDVNIIKLTEAELVENGFDIHGLLK